ncbi:aminotransferase class V-fold PLP-dependent enzyme (plasmid) [Paracoccus sp. Arc7-R13]|uniref:aminotransferase class V-fold PLP-dependent enzyme n=1 Tax=Paracoccus sp. Arc7-R13 TaxID=2500532 RepID=UPI000FDAF58C|nr:aminotransferase class V-fold PLP-dependent enzyme [Paracoccus sp. Arc7-R13]AZY95742.1 aminotransferase class V-fold PLP-dependent enzyme [Paracoccus sp. Arc7-R13]
MAQLDEFRATLTAGDAVAGLRAGLIGDDVVIDGPFGPVPMIYADYVASGRALRQVEEFVLTRVLPYYANTHTQASFVGAYCSGLREAARSCVAGMVGAGPGYSTIFAGSGSTAGLNRLVGLLDIAGITARGGRAVVVIGPYEHHSNILPWRESGAVVIEIPEAATGGPDLPALDAVLADQAGADLLVGSFSAASNVTGILTDTDAVTRILRAHGAVAIWDYGAAARYVPMSMQAGTDAAKDAIVFSPHKFPGGPGASGVLVVRDAIARRATPTLPGGGTVSFVSPWGHAYASSLSAREEGGTPNVIGDIRVALAMIAREVLGQNVITTRGRVLRDRALAAWRGNPAIQVMAPDAPGDSLPILSFRIHDGRGGLVHHQLFTRMLSDIHGVQARGGCACAGSYAHRLLGIDRVQSDALSARIAQGEDIQKPGWVRLNFSVLLDDAKADRIIDAVDDLARNAARWAGLYQVDPATSRFTLRPDAALARIA